MRSPRSSSAATAWNSASSACSRSAAGPVGLAQNPKTLEKVPVPPKRVVKFKVGNVLKQKVEEQPPKPAAGDADDGQA